MTTAPSRRVAAPTEESHGGAAITPALLMRWGGAAGMLAGALQIVANLLHPPRSFATLAYEAQHATWEVVHLLAIFSFVVSAFAVIAIYAAQIERSGPAGLIGFIMTLAGTILTVGLLVPDSLIFPILARDPEAIRLLGFPGPIIGRSLFTTYMAISGAIYTLGSVLFFAVSARAGVLPRWGSLLIALGIIPLGFGALVWQGVDYVGAVAVGVGYLWLGYALWSRDRSLRPAR